MKTSLKIIFYLLVLLFFYIFNNIASATPCASEKDHPKFSPKTASIYIPCLEVQVKSGNSVAYKVYLQLTPSSNNNFLFSIKSATLIDKNANTSN